MDHDRRPPRDKPPASPVEADRAEREARLAKALRDNLRRRKAAARPAREGRSEDG